MSFLSLAEQIGTLLALVGAGWLLRRTGILAREDVKPINAVIIYAGLPAMIFTAVHPARLDWELGVIALVGWTSVGVSMAVAWGASGMLRLPSEVSGGFMMASALGNTGYIGYPVSQRLLGAQGLLRAIFYDVMGTVAALALVGVPLARAKGRHNSGPAGHPVRELLAFPAVVAFGVALATRPIAVPVLLGDGLGLLAKMVVPLIMLSVGISLRGGAVRAYALPLAIVCVIKLLISPLAALAAGSGLGLEQEAVRLSVLQAGMPSMMLNLVVGARFGLDTDFIAAAILTTTVAAVFTIPLLQLPLI